MDNGGNYMKAQIEINLDNDAFQRDGRELARVLRNIAEDVEACNVTNEGAYICIIDINGNKAGQLEIIEDNK
jgi:hypothetical protein